MQQPKDVHHRHGGEITAVYAIAHSTYKKSVPANWFFVCDVKWSDGTSSERTEVPPNMLVSDTDEGRAQISALCGRLDAYLRASGEWLDKPKSMRGGYLVHWVPTQPKGEQAL